MKVHRSEAASALRFVGPPNARSGRARGYVCQRAIWSPSLAKGSFNFLGKAATAASFGALNRKADYSALGAEVTIEKLPHQGVCLWVAEAVSSSFHQAGALGLKYAFAPSKFRFSKLRRRPGSDNLHQSRDLHLSSPEIEAFPRAPPLFPSHKG